MMLLQYAQQKNEWKLHYFGSFMSNILFNSPRENKFSSLRLRIREVQVENKQLQLWLKQQLDVLNSNIINHQILGKHMNQLLPQKIEKQHAEIHSIWSNHLLKAQIQIQEEAEMNELIKNYEKRIADLQVALINKETEIVQSTYDEEKETIVRKQNMQNLHKQSLEKITIKRALNDLKKLKYEIDALEYSLNFKIQKTKSLNSTKDFNILSSIHEKTSTIKQQSVSFKEKANGIYRDKLLMKIYKLLEIQLSKEENLRKQLSGLKGEWEVQSKNHRHHIRKYKKQGPQKSILTDLNLLSHEEKKINFLEELEKTEKRRLKDNILFHQVDQNVSIFHKGKSEKKQAISREKGSKVNKEN